MFNTKNAVMLLCAVFITLNFLGSPIATNELELKYKIEHMLKQMHEEKYEILSTYLYVCKKRQVCSVPK